MSKARTLESFDKKDLIEFIKNSSFFFARDGERMARDLSWIEFKRKSGELTSKMDVLHAEMGECSLPQDWRKYRELSGKWDAANRAWDRLYRGLK